MSDLPIFVASPIEVYHDSKAAEMLNETNDNRFASPDGVIAVDQQRWEKAQAYERDTWLKYNREATQDRNDHHKEQFDGYTSLPENLGDVLEIGCGPFTNINTIMQAGHSVDSIVLVDPLLNDYLEHPNCTYKSGSPLAEKVKKLHSISFEDAELDEQFDTIVLINALAHCKDARVVFEKIVGALKPGGLLIFAEFPREVSTGELYDVGHPIGPKTAFLEAFLSNFNQVYRSGWYFVGRLPGKNEPEQTADAMRDYARKQADIVMEHQRELEDAYISHKVAEDVPPVGISPSAVVERKIEPPGPKKRAGRPKGKKAK